MKDTFKQRVLELTNAYEILDSQLIQTLWSGYGEILKLNLAGGDYPSVIVKYIDLPISSKHPRGWNTARSHQRKVKSYDVEMHWYSNYSSVCDNSCRVAKCLGSDSGENSHIIVMEDLDAAGFPQRGLYDDSGVESCLTWLAHFHGKFLHKVPTGLWDVGTYWHLETRPDELNEMKNGDLKKYAARIDQKLNSCKYLSIVHGDAKVANFCFSNDYRNVAAVDFQYVGGGCGMKDVAYFLGSCLDEYECERGESKYLDFYFSELKKAVAPSINFSELEEEWREMYSWAWTDFYRFLLGWMPTHYKIHGYTKKLSQKVLRSLR